jgi:SAM-dependent methyltransferase
MLPEQPRWVTYTPEAAEQLYLRETFRMPSRGRHRPPMPEAFTRAWFEQVEHQRYRRHGTWIPRVLEFGRHAGETLVGLGDGLGTDWLQYARHGTHVIACSQSNEQLGLIERNFRLREQEIRVAHAPPHALPFDGSSVDVVCIQGLLHEVERPELVIDEVYRILRPGGKVIAVAPARYDAAYWHAKLFPWRRWFSRAKTGGPRGTTARHLKRDFARFGDRVVKKRHLRRSQLPQLWRPFPLGLLERFLGQLLILKAFKPLSAALAAQVAA